jgi:hypothetical protein
MWWLTYRRSGNASGVVLIEAPSLVHARTQASLEAVDAGAERYAGRSSAGGAVGRMLTIEEAR